MVLWDPNVISWMTSMSLKDCIHAFRQGLIQFIDEVIRNSKESSLACLPEFIKILWFCLPCFLFHPTPDMLNDVHVWWLGWPILEHLDLFLILCTWRWDTLKVSATSAVDLVFSLLIISTLVLGWLLGMLSEVKLQLMWRIGVLGFFLYTPKNWLINYWSQVKL